MRFEALLTIVNCNMRAEKSGDDVGPLGVDIKLSGTIHLETMGNILSDPHAQALLDHLCDAEGNLRTDAIDRVVFNTEHKMVTAELHVGPDHVKFEDGKFNQISAEPRIGKTFDFSGRLQVHPTSKQLGRLGEMLGSEAKVIVESKQADITDPPRATEPAASLPGDAMTSVAQQDPAAAEA